MNDGEYTVFGMEYVKNITIKQVEDYFWKVTAEYIERRNLVLSTKCELIANHLPTHFNDNQTIEVNQGQEPVLLILEKLQEDQELRHCVVAEIVTPKLLVASLILEIEKILENEPEIISFKDRDIMEKCRNLVLNDQEIHKQDLMDLHNLAYVIYNRKENQID